MTEQKLAEGRATMVKMSALLVVLQTALMWYHGDDSPLSALEWFADAAIVFGFVLRMWSVGTLGKFFTNTIGLRKEHRLVTAGPYRWLAHPSYTAAMLLNLAFYLHLRVPLVVRLALMLFLSVAWGRFLARRVRAEEALMRKHFGAEFDAYVADRFRFVPFVY